MSNPIVRFDVTVEYVFKCAECQAEARSSHPHCRMEELMMPWVPERWTIVNGHTFCPLHELTLDVRGHDGIRTRTLRVIGDGLWQ